MSFVFNDETTLKHQLLLSYTIITIVSAGITLAICYGLLYALGKFTQFLLNHVKCFFINSISYVIKAQQVMIQQKVQLYHKLIQI